MKAKREIIKTPKVVTTYTEEEVYTLTLTKDEALTLAAVAYKVGGDPSGRRGHIASMLDELERVGAYVRRLDDCNPAQRTGINRQDGLSFPLKDPKEPLSHFSY